MFTSVNMRLCLRKGTASEWIDQREEKLVAVSAKATGVVSEDRLVRSTLRDCIGRSLDPSGECVLPLHACKLMQSQGSKLGWWRGRTPGSSSSGAVARAPDLMA